MSPIPTKMLDSRLKPRKIRFRLSYHLRSQRQWDTTCCPCHICKKSSAGRPAEFRLSRPESNSIRPRSHNERPSNCAFTDNTV